MDIWAGGSLCSVLVMLGFSSVQAKGQTTNRFFEDLPNRFENRFLNQSEPVRRKKKIESDFAYSPSEWNSIHEQTPNLRSPSTSLLAPIGLQLRRLTICYCCRSAALVFPG